MCLDWHLNLMICIAIWADGSEFKAWGCFKMVAQCSLEAGMPFWGYIFIKEKLRIHPGVWGLYRGPIFQKLP